MITDLINLIAQGVIFIIAHTGYAGVFGLMFLESAGLPVPSEVIMPFSGFLVADGRLTLWAIILMGSLGNIFGSIFLYWVGKAGGRTFVDKYGKFILLSHHDLDLAERWFTRYGDWAIFFGRLLPVVRTYISFPAGFAKMNFRKFVAYTTFGVLPWTALFAWLGVKMGDNWTLIREKLHSFDILMLAMVILFVVWYIWRHVKRINKDQML